MAYYQNIGLLSTQNNPQTSSRFPQRKVPAEPCRLINISEDGRFHVDQDGLEVIKSLKGPLVVMAITGMYRTGKSYLMNRIARRSTGFKLGAATSATTRGIWIWALQHPTQEGVSILLMDTQGLQDAYQGCQTTDVKILTLASLLSSVVVYNIRGQIDDGIISMLNYVSGMMHRLYDRQRSDGDVIFPLKRAPQFVLAIRDFSLELSRRGSPISADDYLNRILETNHAKDDMYNTQRRTIKRVFKTRRCFTLDRPADRVHLNDLENTSDDLLSVDFLEELKKLCIYLYECQPMAFEKGQYVYGGTYGTLVMECVSAFEGGAVLPMKSAYQAVVAQKAEEAFHKAIERYNKVFQVIKDGPLEERNLIAYHHRAQKDAIKCFRSEIIEDPMDKDLYSLLDTLTERFEHFSKENLKWSMETCDDTITEGVSWIMDCMQAGSYDGEQGFQRYIKNIYDMIRIYADTRNLGVAKNERFMIHLNEKLWPELLNKYGFEQQNMMALRQRVQENEKSCEEWSKRMNELKCQHESLVNQTRLLTDVQERGYPSNPPRGDDGATNDSSSDLSRNKSGRFSRRTHFRKSKGGSKKQPTGMVRDTATPEETEEKSSCVVC